MQRSRMVLTRFWCITVILKGESQVIRGMKKRRDCDFGFQHDISLLGYHLPLDAHPTLGNNAQLAARLGIRTEGVMDERELQGVGSRRFAG